MIPVPRPLAFLPALLLAMLLLAPAALAGPAHHELPEDHEYQRTLRAYLAGLKEADYAVADQPFALPSGYAGQADLEELCRLWMLSRQLPPIGGLSAPASAFTLQAIEGPEVVNRPPADPLALAWLAQWDHPANPYHGSTEVKRRALAAAIVDLVMTDGLHELSGDKDWVVYGRLTGVREDRAAHSDCLGGTLIWLTYVQLTCLDVAPAEVQKAYRAGVEKLVRRMNEWGPARLMTDMDLFAGVSLAYLIQSGVEPELEQLALDYVRPLYTHPRFFHPAGFWVDIQGFDASYNGISFYFAQWAALASGWDFAEEAVDRAWELKSYLALPEPGDRGYVAPAHFSPRTSADSLHDQWNFPVRNPAAVLLTDHAQFQVDVPADEELRRVPEQLLAELNSARAGGAQAKPTPWSEVHWTHAFNFAQAHYRPGFLAHRRMLEQEHPELLRPPFEREENFVRVFGGEALGAAGAPSGGAGEPGGGGESGGAGEPGGGGESGGAGEDAAHAIHPAFVIAKYDDFGVVLHTGSVGEAEADWPTRAKWMPRDKIYGFSGGSLAAFWTPQGGAMMLGRRGGAQGEIPDRFEDWRLWPFHVVAGETAEGKVFTSGRILHPQVSVEKEADRAAVTVSGPIPREYVGQGTVLAGRLDYRRTFEVTPAGLSVRTEVSSDGQDDLAELCELLPVFLALNPSAAGPAPVTVRFLADGQWREAATDYLDQVEAVEIQRFDGTLRVTFQQPQRVKLSPEVWQDRYQSRATCRTLLIDLRGDPAAPFRQASVAYTIAPAPSSEGEVETE